MRRKQPPQYLTVPEIAYTLRISRSYVYKLFDTGQLAYIKIGRSKRVRPEVFQKFIRLHSSEFLDE